MHQATGKRRVFVSEAKVSAYKAESLVPPGYRLATPGEIVAAGGDLARRLREGKLAVWTGQIGSKSCYCIVRDGQAIEVGYEEFKSTPKEERIQFYGGVGRIVVCGNPLFYYTGHDLNAFGDTTAALSVAYIKEDCNSNVAALVPYSNEALLGAQRK